MSPKWSYKLAMQTNDTSENDSKLGGEVGDGSNLRYDSTVPSAVTFNYHRLGCRLGI